MTIKTNESVGNHLRQIARMYELRRETQRSIAFNRAADAVSGFDEDVSTLTDHCVIPNIGPSSAFVIQQYLEKGTSDRYDDLSSKTNTVELKLDLESFAAAGLNALVALGIWNRHKIGNIDQLKAAIKSGSFEEEAIVQKLGYVKTESVEASVSKLKTVLDDIASFGLCIVAGSYRRQRPFIKDLDFVIVANPAEVYQQLESSGYKVLHGGDQKIRIQLDTVEADVLVTTKDEWATAILYLTGSFEHNIKMRGVAKSKGMVLNEHGLFKDEVRIDTPTEESVFEALGIKFTEPKSRV